MVRNGKANKMTTAKQYITWGGSRIEVAAPFKVTGTTGPVTLAAPLNLAGNPYESILARITDNRKKALANICVDNGYTFTPARVEEKRNIISMAAEDLPLIQITRPMGMVENEGSSSDEHSVIYSVFFYATAPDGSSSDPEIMNQFRNVIADIQRAWMQDIYCGQLAEDTHNAFYHDDVVEDSSRQRFYVAEVGFEVIVRTNSQDPYSLG